MENNVETILLNDEEGKETEFDVLTKLDIEDKEYLIVAPTGEEDIDAIALRIDKDAEGNDILVTIEDDEEFEMISEAYETIFSEED
ncbi:DUF1292 domain-containing protein [Clostridium tagluense]|uniref:UPF0473 protein Ctaglu_38300 n=1 Tax=Clostridium tagluense TaxID=360422 RepID=A0A401URQ6_9CLOT|nr:MULTISPECIES: DUF1292 domain-containing protein [Clostridium]MBU3126296.1 DUF1292 domain-containing protein [Clostridium tagluense]MBW9155976.1 DUF1292 domain-containing protein [Clostridium tagluense]MBZ9624134.1 DUF1292 domain-containing protein [Clostridium sp. FP2]MBZ9635636.1 DUF1292 domain-containing protein [Clostridium sp. FP1]MCB2298414.1 DUF1292 domain-containing protein [Clostridium tagluense]